jgi:hypothetical protein
VQVRQWIRALFLTHICGTRVVQGEVQVQLSRHGLVDQLEELQDLLVTVRLFILF